MSTASVPRLARLRTRWSAIGAAVAITLGGGGLGLAQAAVGSGDKPITVTVDAERVLDTRVNLGLAGGFATDTPRDIQITGSVDVARPNTTTAQKIVVPAGATAALVNVTVVAPTAGGFLTLRAKGATGVPATSTVNFVAGAVEPNAATVDLSSDGQIQVWVRMGSASATADVLIDIVGYTVDHDHDDQYYTQEQIDAGTVELQDEFNTVIASATATKANSADVYTRAQVDAMIDRLDLTKTTVEETRVNSVGSPLPGRIISVDVETGPDEVASVVVLSTINIVNGTPGRQLQCAISDSFRDGDYLQIWDSPGDDGSPGQMSAHRSFEIGPDTSVTYGVYCAGDAGFLLEDLLLTAVVARSAAP